MRIRHIGWVVLVAACGGAEHAPAAAPTTTSTHATSGARAAGYDIVVKATSCWMGGFWSDALGEREFERQAGIDKRCKEVLATIAETPDTLPALRAIEPKIVGEIAERVKRDATKDEAASELVALLGLVADAMRETLHARRAADKVKEDAEKDRTQYAPDKVKASPELRQSSAMHALVSANVGPYTADAHTLGILVALDRVEIGHALPKHLKLFAVAAPFEDVLGARAPAVSEDGSMKLEPGTWLTYLTAASAAGNRPVPADLKQLEDRETYAWNGTLDGMGDKLAAASAEVPAETSLGTIARAVTTRLHQQMEMERAHLKSQK